MSTPTNPYGPFANSVRNVNIFKEDFVKGITNAAHQIPGFLCNFQVPVMWDLASRINGTMVEVGVWKGRTTCVLASGGKMNLKLECVDFFTGSEEHQEELKGTSTKDEFLANTAPFRDMITVVEKSSEEASKEYNDKSLDAVWIDAAHDYTNVCLDIVSWTPKIKSGGLILGHDYPNPDDPNGGFQELFKAVNELVRDDKVKYYNFGYVAGLWGAFVK